MSTTEPGSSFEFRCPFCQGPLRPVLQPAGSMLNQDQFAAIRAGDYYCVQCKGEQSATGFRYFWRHELAALEEEKKRPSQPSTAALPTNRPPPPWLGKALAIAKHQDAIASWPRWARLAHRLFIARRCPCCIAAKAMEQDHRKAMQRIRFP